MRILIVGSNGHLGSKIAGALRSAGDVELVAATRAEGFDVRDPATLGRVSGAFDVVVDNVSAYRAGGFPRPDHRRIEREGHRNLAAFAKARGARAVLVGVLGSDAVDESVPHFLEKRLAEERYREAGVALTTVRPGMFLDQEDGRIEKGLNKGVYEHIGPLDVRFAVVETDAVVDAVVAAVRSAPASAFEVREVALGNWTAHELAAQMAKRRGRPIRASALSLGAFSAMTAIPALFSPGLRNLRGMMRFIASGRFVAERVAIDP
jgi:uncharacterized protein YbjT (DUF2867 family)